MNFAIVGTGPSAWSTYMAIMKMRPEVDISFIDVGKRFSSAQQKIVGAEAQKTKFGSDYMYEVSGSNLESEFQSPYSMANGGFSSSWGAGLRVWPETELKKINLDLAEIHQSAKDLLSVIPYTGTSDSLGLPAPLKIEDKPFPIGSDSLIRLCILGESTDHVIIRPSLAIETSGHNACVGCGRCLTGCPYGSILDFGDLVDRLIATKRASRIFGRVEKVEQKSGTVWISILQNDITKTLQFDRVFLCAGALGTPQILMNSGYLPDKVEIIDSQVFYFLGLKNPFYRSPTPKFALSELSFYTKMPQEKIYASLYQSNDETRSRISKKIRKVFRLPFFPVPRFLDRCLIFGIGFIHSDFSGKMKLTKMQSGGFKIDLIENQETKKSIAKALKTIRNTLGSKKLFIIPKITLTPLIGGGFHLGGGVVLDSKFTSLDGTLKNANMVHISDTSLLPFLEPGPHTFTSMCVNYSLVTKCLG